MIEEVGDARGVDVSRDRMITLCIICERTLLENAVGKSNCMGKGEQERDIQRSSDDAVGVPNARLLLVGWDLGGHVSGGGRPGCGEHHLQEGIHLC